MECVICKKSFTIELSVCPACGTMQEDSVREELIAKSSPKVSKYLCYENSPAKSDEIKEILKPAEPEMIFVSSEPEIISKPFIAKLISINEKSEAMPNKPKSQFIAKPQNLPVGQTPKNQPKAENLIEFQQKSNVIPEWRLQLQNAVREKMQSRNTGQEVNQTVNSSNRVLRSNGNAALKIAPVKEEIEIEEPQAKKTVIHENETVRNALKRIELSRRHYYVEEEQPEVETVNVSNESKEKKEYSLQLASSKNSGELRPAKKNSIAAPPRPTLVSSLRKGKEDFDTNKLPPLPQSARIVSSLQNNPVETIEKTIVEEKIEVKIVESEIIEKETVAETTLIETKNLSEEEIKYIVDTEAEEEFKKNQEIEDYAPFTLRINAGVFDLLIGAFTSLILLSPWMLSGSGEWFTFPGLFAFLATMAVVMFIYMTTAVGLVGKTFGMRLFSLELIDIENEDYPSFHQAAVSSAVYLASMALCGLGFLTVPFNEDQRAVHDLVSNTLVVKEL